MLERRSLKGPVTLGVVMIVLVVVLAAVWFVGNYLAVNRPGSIALWVLIAVGGILLAAVLGGFIAYLTLTVQAINLTRRQSNFIDSVTHELKSPIASLKLYLQTLGRRNVDDVQRADFHRFMLEDVERLDSLINHLLDAGRVGRDDPTADDREHRPIDLADLLTDTAAAVCLRYRVPPDTVSLSGPPIELIAPPVQTEIVFRNLIDNAVKYGGGPPRVEVTASIVDGQCVVEVADNGRGIPANQRRRIFGRFVRLGSELQRDRPGTGLGLYLVRNITRQLNGRIEVADRDGGGTAFTVRLPHARVIDGDAGHDHPDRPFTPSPSPV